jgi:hypothetical protein
MFVKPKPGLVVRDPISKRPLPAEGAEVPAEGYWLRRLRSGDVVQAVQIPDSSEVASGDRG